MFDFGRCMAVIAMLIMSTIVVPAWAKNKSNIAKENDVLMPQGMWKDPKTKLIWQRCSLGQTWNGVGCDGEAIYYSFDEAYELTAALGAGWRVPEKSELLGLVRCSKGFRGTGSVPTKSDSMKAMESGCQDGYVIPTIDTNIFPNTTDDYRGYWSASFYEGSGKYAWGVSFNGGHSYGDRTSIGGYVRAVRFSQ